MIKVLVMGATSGIGMEVSRIYAKQGAELFLVARDPQKLESVKSDLKNRGAAKVGGVAVDLSDVSRHGSVIAQAEKELGAFERVFVFYGTLGDQKKSEADPAEAVNEINTNFVSAASLLTIVANKLEKQQIGTITVVSSVAGDRGRQSNYVYGSAKGGLTIFLQGLRNRLYSSGVHVLTVKPGFVDTPMTAHLPKNALFASPEKIAKGIYKATESKKNVVYLPGFWWVIMTIIKHVPESIFKRLKL